MCIRDRYQRRVHGNYTQLIDALKQEFAKLSEKNQSSSINISWMGRRFGDDLIPEVGQQANNQKDIAPEFINYDFLSDINYHHYEDWQQVLENECTEYDLFAHKPSTDNFHSQPRIREGLITNPSKPRQFVKPLSFNLNWEYTAFDFPLEHIQRAAIEDAAVANTGTFTQYAAKILNLQNFKYETRTLFTEKQIADNLLGRKFIQTLIESHLKIREKFRPEYMAIQHGLQEQFEGSPIIRDPLSYFCLLYTSPSPRDS
eukprot:TRINITY_DN2868_c0_g5_i1.p1 TRINITY_DN2868_c0_g5~~TRINITY_DN2868_c0_g5_i1.p1  ORF type:complete len:258 (-),score=47.84 TRINITY_DN2868_c0_g5_i1:78-851(-)